MSAGACPSRRYVQHLDYSTSSMFAINRRQLYKIAQRRGILAQTRGNVSQAGEMVVKSPREVNQRYRGSPQLTVDLQSFIPIYHRSREGKEDSICRVCLASVVRFKHLLMTKCLQSLHQDSASASAQRYTGD